MHSVPSESVNLLYMTAHLQCLKKRLMSLSAKNSHCSQLTAAAGYEGDGA